MEFIQDYVNERIENGDIGYDIAETLGVSVSMVSCYKKGDYNPSLAVALRMYDNEKIVLHPFSAESLQIELDKGMK